MVDTDTPEPWLDEIIESWKKDGTVPSEDAARGIAQLWLDDMEGPDLEETNLAGFVSDGTIDPDLKDWVSSMLETLGRAEEQTESQQQQAAELGAWLAYLEQAG